MSADKLTKEERAVYDRVNEGKPEPGDLLRLLSIVHRLASKPEPEPEPERLWVNVWRGKGGAWVDSFTSEQDAAIDRDKLIAAYLGRVIINLDGSQPTWEGPDA